MSNSLYTLLCTLRFAQKTAYNKNNCVCVCDGISTKQMILTILVCKKKEGGGWIRSLQPMMTLLVSQWHDPGTLGSRWFSPMVSQSHPRFALNHVAETRGLTPSHVIVCVRVRAGKEKIVTGILTQLVSPPPCALASMTQCFTNHKDTCWY